MLFAMSTQTHDHLDIGQVVTANIAANVRAAMARYKVGDAQLALGIGGTLSRSALNRRTSGEIPFDVDLLARIADYLGITLDELMRDASTTPPPQPPRHPRGRRGDVRLPHLDSNQKPAGYQRHLMAA